MAYTLYKVGWDSLALSGWQSIPKSSYFASISDANSFADRLLIAGKVNVFMEAPEDSVYKENL